MLFCCFRVLYVVIAVALCFIVGGLLLFFLFPRSVSMTSDQPSLYATNIYINISTPVLIMTITVCLLHVTKWAVCYKNCTVNN